MISGKIPDRPSGFEGMQLELTWVDDAWVVEARVPESGDPPLRLIFRGPRAYEQALEFYMGCAPARDTPTAVAAQERRVAQTEVAES